MNLTPNPLHAVNSLLYICISAYKTTPLQSARIIQNLYDVCWCKRKINHFGELFKCLSVDFDLSNWSFKGRLYDYRTTWVREAVSFSVAAPELGGTSVICASWPTVARLIQPPGHNAHVILYKYQRIRNFSISKKFVKNWGFVKKSPMIPELTLQWFLFWAAPSWETSCSERPCFTKQLSL